MPKKLVKVDKAAFYVSRGILCRNFLSTIQEVFFLNFLEHSMTLSEKNHFFIFGPSAKNHQPFGKKTFGIFRNCIFRVFKVALGKMISIEKKLFGPWTKSYRLFCWKVLSMVKSTLYLSKLIVWGESFSSKNNESFQVICDIERKNFGVWQKIFRQVCRKWILRIQKNRLRKKLFLAKKKRMFLQILWDWAKNSCLWDDFEENLFSWKKFSALFIDGHSAKSTGMRSKNFSRDVKTRFLPIHWINLSRKFFNGKQFIFIVAQWAQMFGLSA